MKKSCLLLVAVILIAGCTQSSLTPIVKNMPEVKEFLNQYPEATITASAYSPTAVKFVVENFREHCPNLGEEGKSYQKVTVIDGKTKQTLIVWVEAKNNEFICAIRTSLSGEVVTTTSTSTSLSTTTTLPPTTTTAQITTTSQPTTTTLPPTTTTANATNATNASTTTTTIPSPTLSDIIANASVSPVNSTRATFYITIKNIGQNTTGSDYFTIKYGIWNAGGSIFTTQFMYNNLSAGQSYTHEWTSIYSHAPGNYYFNVSADTDNIVNESIENNNKFILNYTMPLPQPDLYISYLTAVKRTDNGNYNTSFIVKNSGALKSNATSVQYKILNASAGNATVPNSIMNTPVSALEPGASQVYSSAPYNNINNYVNLGSGAGTYFAVVTADLDENNISNNTEGSELNNVKSVKFDMP